jgi:hypothetical protein
LAVFAHARGIGQGVGPHLQRSRGAGLDQKPNDAVEHPRNFDLHPDSHGRTVPGVYAFSLALGEIEPLAKFISRSVQNRRHIGIRRILTVTVRNRGDVTFDADVAGRFIVAVGAG